MRVIITGSRDWGNEPQHEKVMQNILSELPEDAVLVHGDARGADSMAEMGWGLRWGRVTEKHPANWNRQADGSYDKAAGFKRNEFMVHKGADLCIAFVYGSANGTMHCANYALKRGIDTWFVSSEGQIKKVSGEVVDDVWAANAPTEDTPALVEF